MVLWFVMMYNGKDNKLEQFSSLFLSCFTSIGKVGLDIVLSRVLKSPSSVPVN